MHTKHIEKGKDLYVRRESEKEENKNCMLLWLVPSKLEFYSE